MSGVLDSLYNEEFEKMKRFVSGRRGNLSVDAWSGPSRDPTLGYAITVDCKTYLTALQDTSGQPHTAENVACWVDDYITEIESSTGVRIVTQLFPKKKWG